MTEETVWGWFSKFIRLRDADERGLVKCATCGRFHFWKEVDAGHFITRNKKSTKYDEKNVFPQCAHCNRFAGGKQYEMGLYIDKRYGPGTAESILIKSKQLCKRTRYDLQVLGNYYREEVKKLKKAKGL